MATYIRDRSTYWVNTGNNTPDPTGDYRCYWKFYYEQTDEDKLANRSKLIIKYYAQTYKTSGNLGFIVSSTNSNVKINGSSIGSISTGESVHVQPDDEYRLVYLGEKTKTISHNTDGSCPTYTFQGSGYGKSTAVSTYSSDFPKINRYSTLGTISPFDIDNGFVISINKYVATYYDRLQVLYGSTVLKTVNGVENGQTIEFTETELDNIYTLIPTGQNASFTIKLTTYSDSNYTNSIGSNSKNVTGNFTLIAPEFDDVNYRDDWDIIVENVTGNNQTIIGHSSYVVIEIPEELKAVAKTRGASIKRYIVNNALTANEINGALEIELGHITNSQNYFTIQAIDSRETASPVITKTYSQFIDYKLIYLQPGGDAVRTEDGVGRIAHATFEGTWFNGNLGLIDNKLDLKVYYKESGQDDSAYVLGDYEQDKFDTTSEPGRYSYDGEFYSQDETDRGFDLQKSYIFKIVITDLNYCELESTDDIPYGEPAVALYKNKAAIGGPYDETLGGTQIWNDLYINGDEYKKQETNIAQLKLNATTSLTWNSWSDVVVPLESDIIIGSKLTYENGMIKVGTGVSYVKASGVVRFDFQIENGAVSTKLLRRRINETGDYDTFGPMTTFYNKTSTQIDITAPVPQTIIPVQEGDYICLAFQTGEANSNQSLKVGTNMVVEVIE